MLVILNSNPSLPFCHWPDTNGVFETFLTGPFDQLTFPTIVERLVELIEAITADVSSKSEHLLITSAVTSNNACWNPNPWFHFLPVVETYPFPSSLALVPVKLLEKGWSGVHQISDVKPLPLSPNEFTNEGKLIGHIALGRDIVKEATKKIKNFPLDLVYKIEHIILSQDVTRFSKSQKSPSFPESLLVNKIKDLDSKMNKMDIIMKEDQGDGDFTNKYNYFRGPLLKKNAPWRNS